MLWEAQLAHESYCKSDKKWEILPYAPPSNISIYSPEKPKYIFYQKVSFHNNEFLHLEFGLGLFQVEIFRFLIRNLTRWS